MKKVLILISASLLLWIFISGCENSNENGETENMEEKLSQFAETEITFDESLLDERQKIVLTKLYEASKIVDELFLTQVYSENTKILEELENSDDPEDSLKLEYFKIMFGPFDRLNDDEPFIDGYKRPDGANFYLGDITKVEIETWLKLHPEDEKDFTSEFTVIKEESDSLIAIPYSKFYQEKLFHAAKLLREAAEYADNKSLKKYLALRADAFESNDYYESDMAWMDLKDNDIEVVIGPYEVYEDKLFNYKASFESFVNIVDPAETEKLKKFAGYLTEMEKNLPIPEEYKNYERGSESPIVVVQEVFSAGDSKAGVQTLAFNLPNDERVRKAKGSKKVMLKNIHEAKFDKLLEPIAEIVLVEDQLPYVTFNGFFNHTLMHEMSHGVGPGFISVDGRETEVKKELKETYSTMEEAKADILGIWNNLLMIEKGVYPEEFEKEIYATFLAGIFRSVRFGIEEAHGGANAIIYNYLLEKGAFEFNAESEKVSVNYDKAYEGVKDLANKLLMIQATGNYEGALEMIEKYGVNSKSMEILRDKLSELPVDIKPVYQIEKEYEQKKNS